MPNLRRWITNIELSSKVDGCSTITFPTLKKLSVDDVITIWSSVSKHVREQLLQDKPWAVSITGLGTFHIQKWLSFEKGEVLTFQRPVFSLSKTVANIRELQHASVPLPGEMKKVSVSYKKIQSDIPYSKEVVENCMQETLNFFYFILRNRQDTDFFLKDIGTLVIRGTEVTMAFCEDFLLSLNKSAYIVEKLLTKKGVKLDKEVTLSPSRFRRVHQFPQFEIRTVPRRDSTMDEEAATEFESALSRLGVRASVHHTLCLLRRNVSADGLVRALMEQEAEKKMQGIWPSDRLLPERTGTQGWQHGETPSESPELPPPTWAEHAQIGQRMQSVFRMNSRPKLKAFMMERKEEDENRKAGRVTLTELLQQQAGREVSGMQRTQLPQEHQDSLSFPETTSNAEEGLQRVEAWTQARRQFQAELESLGDVEKWLAHKPFLSILEERYLQRLKAQRDNRRAAATSAVIDSLENKDRPMGRKEKCWKVRSGDGPVEKHCLPSTIEGHLGELVDRYRKNAVMSYQKSSELCQERSVHITDATLQTGLLHPGDRIVKEGDNIMKIRQPGGYYSIGYAGSTSSLGSASGSQDKAAKTRHLQRNETQMFDDSKFWPGHLLDKLCLYFPEKKHDRAHALFSYVPPPKTIYHGF